MANLSYAKIQFSPKLIPPNTSIVAMPTKMAEGYALQRLREGKNIVLAGRDDISLKAEKELKDLGKRNNCWIWTPHAFAHEYNKGPVGIVGTAGTAIQHVVCLLDEVGIGVSDIYSVGARDLSEFIGGEQTFRAVRLLENCDDTEVIVLLIKPISPEMHLRLVDTLKSINKPCVLYTVGRPLTNKVEAVICAESLAQIPNLVSPIVGNAISAQTITRDNESFVRRPGYIRGLFSGGSSCDEVVGVLQSMGFQIHSNSPISDHRISNLWSVKGHSCIDLGAGVTHKGKLHFPMVDLSLKIDRIIKEASNPACSVLLFDVFLGYGSHDNPAPILSAAIRRARAKRYRLSGDLIFIATVVGTKRDPQGLELQRDLLRSAGVSVTKSITEAAFISGRCIAH